MKKHGIQKVIVGGILAGTLILTAAAVQGSESDPLVTLGYLTDQFLPKVVSEVEVKMAEQDKALESKIQAMLDTYASNMEKKFQKLNSSSGGTATYSGFVTVTLSAGQTLTLSSGSELLYRSGSAVCTSPATPGLVDMTAGKILEDRGVPEADHLYLATADSRGIIASGSVTVLVRGPYTVA